MFLSGRCCAWSYDPARRLPGLPRLLPKLGQLLSASCSAARCPGSHHVGGAVALSAAQAPGMLDRCMVNRRRSGSVHLAGPGVPHTQEGAVTQSCGQGGRARGHTRGAWLPQRVAPRWDWRARGKRCGQGRACEQVYGHAGELPEGGGAVRARRDGARVPAASFGRACRARQGPACMHIACLALHAFGEGLAQLEMHW